MKFFIYFVNPIICFLVNYITMRLCNATLHLSLLHSNKQITSTSHCYNSSSSSAIIFSFWANLLLSCFYFMISTLEQSSHQQNLSTIATCTWLSNSSCLACATIHTFFVTRCQYSPHPGVFWSESWSGSHFAASVSARAELKGQFRSSYPVIIQMRHQ